jgi:saccharopine dehydrogenase-like NADP-dependent oxidoreductase
MELPGASTWADYLRAFLPGNAQDVRRATADYLGAGATEEVLDKLAWLGLFDSIPIGVEGGSPAATLQHLLEQKWRLGPADKDLVVMWHRFRYSMNGRTHELQASLASIGLDPVHTAMARTVGLPIGMACKLALNGAIEDRGVLLPLKPAIYDPVLDELEGLGITFQETERAL